ncbi:pentatricopeptide repeat-containing protein At2g20710, mitochondrial-like isoform X2 [Benincasa hispida]|uniref:pentatricopeptide repeat-containing protein At2g20710, mitochondrial-like isoform X2 n=1 Tax=Benincasa hispida TaxID=102211 RepID=UPI001902AAAC|nr:pentatricopeptide repeat-containing protein At2g20710, mitochondrial-like isoform X2 [Benincasa hispida]
MGRRRRSDWDTGTSISCLPHEKLSTFQSRSAEAELLESPCPKCLTSTPTRSTSRPADFSTPRLAGDFSSPKFRSTSSPRLTSFNLISQWITDRRYFSLSPSDAAIRMDLIHRVHGLEHAENYFNSISSQLKTSNVYGALLCSYVREKSVEKAEAIMQEMRKMGIANTSFPYNVLINLYAQIGQHDKIDLLTQEMKMKGIPQDIYTIRNLCAAYVAKTDIFGLEKILKRIEGSELKADWRIYSIAASGYLSAGLETKALSMLKKMEEKIPSNNNKSAFEFLLALYERTGRKDELYRVWSTFKPLIRQTLVPYALMITSLVKLDDIEGAERIFQEWESKCTEYDFRVLNRLLVAYCRKGLLDKAESVVNQAVVGRTPYASTWSVLATGYAEHGCMSKAVEMLKKAMLVGRQDWRPKCDILEACLDYLEEQGDAETMEEIIRLCKSSGMVAKELYYRLLRTSIAGGKSVLSILEQMKMDGFSVDEEVDKILGTKTNL